MNLIFLLSLCSAPNPVSSLRVESQTNRSIRLCWERPEESDSQNLTYYVQWTGDSNTIETQRTTDTCVTVEELRSGTSYEFSVWVEKDGVNSTRETLNATTGEGSKDFRRMLFNFCALTKFFSFLLPSLSNLIALWSDNVCTGEFQFL